MTEPRPIDSRSADVSADLSDLQVDQLAALHSALDESAAAWQQDVILNAAVEVLVKRDLTCDELAEALNTMWATTAVTIVSVEQALSHGRELQLVTSHDTFNGETRWKATEGAQRDVRSDREWASEVIDAFASEVMDRLSELHVPVKPERRTRITSLVLQALAVGAAGTYEVGPNSSEGYLRPVHFDTKAANSWIQSNVDPTSVREGVKDLVLAAINPLDSFGNDIVHLLVVGNLMRGVMARHDVAQPVGLDGVRLLIDTSVLVDLVADGTAGQTQLLRLFNLTHRLRGEVVVAEHTLEEWERLWDAADSEGPGQIEVADVPEHTEVLVRNPFAQAFVRARKNDPSLNWVRFQVGRRDVRKRLEDLGVNVRPAGNNTPEDRETETQARAEIERLDVPRNRRTTNATEADAASLAMIARWRRDSQSVLPGGYFCARDHLTGTAYANLVPDDEQTLTVNPEGWLLFMARLVAGDPPEQRRLVDVVGSNVVRDAFFAVATGYTVSDALHVANIMRENNHLAARDLQTIVQLELTDAVDVAHDGTTARAHAEEALRLRSERREARAKRAIAAAAEAKQAAEERAQNAEERLTQEVARARDERDREHAAERERTDQQSDAERLRTTRVVRSLVAVVVTLVACLVVVVLWMTMGIPSTSGVALHILAVVAVLLIGLDGAAHPERKWSSVVLPAAFVIVTTVAGILI